MKIFFFLIITVVCIAIALFFPGLSYGVWTMVSPVTEMGRILLASVLLITGLGGFIASVFLSLFLWISGIDAISSF